MFAITYNTVQLNASQLAERGDVDIMICKKCNDEMILDDVDTDFRNAKDRDKYWVCPRCNMCCIEEVRHNKETKFNWYEE